MSARRALSALALAALALSSVSRAAADEPPPPAEVTVRAAPRRRDPARITITADDARKLAGTEGDPLKVVESLPGTARPALGSNQIVLWGAAPGDSRILVDGVEIPALYHAGGLRSVLGAELVRSLDLVPGAYGADHGRALGGLVRVTTRDLTDDRLHADLGVDLLDASGSIRGKIDERLRFAVAARVSLVDRFLGNIVSDRTRAIFPLPRYHDYQGKLTLRLRQDEELSMVLLGAGDRIERSRTSPDPAALLRETDETSFQRLYWRYTRTLTDGSSLSVTPFFGRDHRDYTASFGPIPASLAEDALRAGLRASYRAPLLEQLTLTAGLDLLGSRSSLARAGSLTLPAREGDPYVFGQPPGADVASDRFSTLLADFAPYVLADLRFGPVTITPGLRIDAFLIEGSRLTPKVAETPAIGFSRLEPAIDPRLTVSWAALPRLTLSTAAGVYHQAPAAEDLSAVSGTPALVPSRSMQASLGAAIAITDKLDLELTGHGALLDRLVVRSRLGTPHLARALTQDGEGRSYGAQLMIRQRMLFGLSGFVAYALSRSERRYAGDDATRPFDHDQTHVLTAVLRWEYRSFGAGARFRYATGAPRTPVVGSAYDATFGAFEPIFGAPGSTRLADFHALDLRLDHTSRVGPISLLISLDLLNVTNHQNVEELAYSEDYTTPRPITGLPILAVLGARASL